jgi:uncharacterized protein YqgV (UPF0045/DUF77 family)
MKIDHKADKKLKLENKIYKVIPKSKKISK